MHFKIAKTILGLKGIEVVECKDIDQLFNQIRNHDDTIISKLQQGKLTLDLVIAINADYQRSFLDFSLIEKGNKALLKAAIRFEIPVNDKKKDLINWWIRQEFLDEIFF